MAGTRIRTAVAADLPVLVDLWHRCHTYHYRFDRRYFRLARRARQATAEHYAATLAGRKPGWIFLAEADSQAVGFIRLTVSQRPPVFPSGRLMLVDAVFVEESHRGKKIFSRLLARARRQAKAAGIDRIELMVHVDNPARALYQHCGFTEMQVKMGLDV